LRRTQYAAIAIPTFCPVPAERSFDGRRATFDDQLRDQELRDFAALVARLASQDDNAAIRARA
jgi:hypothetical protein